MNKKKLNTEKAKTLVSNKFNNKIEINSPNIFKNSMKLEMMLDVLDSIGERGGKIEEGMVCSNKDFFYFQSMKMKF